MLVVRVVCEGCFYFVPAICALAFEFHMSLFGDRVYKALRHGLSSVPSTEPLDGGVH